MLKVINLCKRYGNHEVLKNISFEIGKGKIYGFLGQNGAGKSTTMNILTGLIDYNGGEIYLDGMDFRKNKRQLLSRVGYLTQAPVFYNYMNAYEYLKFIGELNKMSLKQIRERTDTLLEIVKLKDSAKRKIGGYSGGMKQRMGLAVAMFTNPEILFLDEPTAALDPEGRMEVLELIGDLKKDGITVFLSSHILNDIERVCDEVSIIDKGELLLSKKLEDLKNDYIQPIYDIEFEREQKDMNNLFANIDWVLRTKADRNKLSVYVRDIDESKTEILKVLVKQNTPVLSFNIRKSTLEDIFIRLVSENGNL